MLRTIEAIIDEHGDIRLLETVSLPAGWRVFLTYRRQNCAWQSS